MKKILIICFLLINLIFLFSTDLSILLWNVKNFFDTKDDPASSDTVLTEKQFQDKLNLISEQIENINPDIVALAEIENIFVIKALANKADYQYFYLLEGNDPRGIDVGFISRYELVYTSHKDYPTPYQGNINYKFSRDCAEAVLTLDNKKLFLLLNHLKSSYGEDDSKSELKRIAQVNGILGIIGEIYEKNANPYVIVLGDLNSERFSEPLNILQKSGLKILNYQTKQENFYTSIYNKNKIDLDYIIFNDLLYSKAKISEYKTINTAAIKKISDHYPIFLKFKY